MILPVYVRAFLRLCFACLLLLYKQVFWICHLLQVFDLLLALGWSVCFPRGCG